MLNIIIGNVCAVGAMLSDSVSGTRKTQKDILLVQCISQVFYICSSLILKGYSATVQNVVAIARNLFAAYDKKNKVLEYVLIILPVVLGIVFNNRGLIGFLPVAANLEYSIAVFAFREKPTMLKYAIIVNNVMFCVFNFAILNFVSGVASIVIIITTSISIIKEKKSGDAEK